MDRRDRAPWYQSFDERRMVLVFPVTVGDEEDGGGELPLLELPAVYAVCDVCDGKGTHVNPNIDRHGLSREDFDEDPDFAEDYLSGLYDVPCHQCHGRRVAPAVDEARCTQAQLAALYRHLDEEADYAALCAAERRMGC